MKPQLLTIVLVTVLVTLLAGSAGCNRSKSVSTPTSPTSPTAPPVVTTAAPTAVAIRGNAMLTAIGETAALTATASLSDGTLKDVTATALWASSDASIVTVSPGGMLTVVRFGQSYVRATYQSKTASLSVQATPAGTFVVWGRTREPGSSGVAGVLVREETSGVSGLSNAEGQFSFAGLTSGRLTFEKDGYEPVAFEGKLNEYNDVAMQRVIRIAAGGTVDVGLAPHDMDYAPAADSRCYPCKMIRVVSTEAGRLQLRVTWKEPRATLNLWINGRLFEGTAPGSPEAVADVPIGAGELLVYVGMTSPVEYYAPFTLTTAVVQ